MKVLMLGKQLELGHYRSEYLRAHGFEVLFPETEDDATATIREGKFDALIVTYTLGDKTAKQLVEMVKQGCSDCPVIAITTKRWDDLRVQADETIMDSAPPQALIEALVRIEKKRTQSNQASSNIRRVK